MFEVLHPHQQTPLHILAQGSLSRQDYDGLIRELEASLGNSRADACWIELKDFQGIEPGSLVEELRFHVRHCRGIRRCVIVGDRAWSFCMTRVARAIFPEADVRYFDPADRDAASQWITSPERTVATCH